jgi:hypothetical protein
VFRKKAMDYKNSFKERVLKAHVLFFFVFILNSFVLLNGVSVSLSFLNVDFSFEFFVLIQGIFFIFLFFIDKYLLEVSIPFFKKLIEIFLNFLKLVVLSLTFGLIYVIAKGVDSFRIRGFQIRRLWSEDELFWKSKLYFDSMWEKLSISPQVVGQIKNPYDISIFKSLLLETKSNDYLSLQKQVEYFFNNYAVGVKKLESALLREEKLKATQEALNQLGNLSTNAGYSLSTYLWLLGILAGGVGLLYFFGFGWATKGELKGIIKANAVAGENYKGAIVELTERVNAVIKILGLEGKDLAITTLAGKTIIDIISAGLGEELMIAKALCKGAMDKQEIMEKSWKGALDDIKKLTRMVENHNEAIIILAGEVKELKKQKK